MARTLTVVSLTAAIAPYCFGQTAQVARGVTHTSQAVIPNVEVEAASLETGIVKKSRSNSEGIYVVPLLPPGEHRLAARAQGFAPVDVMQRILVRIAATKPQCKPVQPTQGSKM